MTTDTKRSREDPGPPTQPPGEGAPRAGESGPAPTGPILYLLRGLEGAAVLTLPVGESARLSVPLTAALARLLYAMDRARQKDDHEAPEVQGWRAAERLGKDVGNLLRFAPSISAQAVTRYVWQIRRRIKAASRKRRLKGAPPEIIESRRGWGYRLATDDLTIIDRSKES